MSLGIAVLAGALAGTAVLSVGSDARARLLAVVPPVVTSPVQPRGPAAGRRTAALLAGAGVALTLGGGVGVLAGVVVTLVASRWFRRLRSRADRDTCRRFDAELPLALDLLAATLRAGLPPADAVAAVGSGDSGPVGQLLAEVAAGLRLGADAEEAWRPAARHPSLRRLVGAAVRGGRSGSRLADTCSSLAAELREERVQVGHAAARRAGVLAALPLAACFLPAFVLVGVVPFAAGLLRSLQA